MDLKQYDGKCVRIIDAEGNVFDGIAATITLNTMKLNGDETKTASGSKAFRSSRATSNQWKAWRDTRGPTADSLIHMGSWRR